MPILNYTTTVPASRSLGEIQERLAAHGADAVTIRYVEREPVALTFTLRTKLGEQTYRLPADIDHMAVLLDRIPRATKTRAQATRVAWRIIKDWVEAQLALIEARQASLDQIMLPYAEVPNGGGTTVYEAYVQHALQLKP